MIYNKYFTTEDEKYLYSRQSRYKHRYHVVVTFPNIASIDKYMQSLYENINAKRFYIYGWHCNTLRKYKKSSNSHPRKKHLHIVLFSSREFEYEKFDTKITRIYDLKNLLEYIHDGHHIIHKKYFKIKSISFKEQLKSLKISSY